MGKCASDGLGTPRVAPIAIGPHTLRSPVLLAPMCGVTDLVFRRLAHGLGAGMVVSEMVASEHLATDRHGVRRRAQGCDLYPFVVQLVGCEAHWMAQGARIAVVDFGAQIIDINMGCPAREVTGKLSGSALMRDLDHATRLIEAVVKAVPRAGPMSVPVTLKMRAGLGPGEPERTGARAPCRGVRRVPSHRARPHPLPAFQWRARLGVRAQRHECRRHSRGGQRGYRGCRLRPCRTACLRRACG